MLHIFNNINLFKPYNTTLYSSIDPRLFLRILNLYILGISKSSFEYISLNPRSNIEDYFKS